MTPEHPRSPARLKPALSPARLRLLLVGAVTTAVVTGWLIAGSVHRAPSSSPLPAGAMVSDFAWSPDGSQLAAVVDVPPHGRDGAATREVWLVNAGGSSPRALKTGIPRVDRHQAGVAWSSSGRYLSYNSTLEDAEVIDVSSATATSLRGGGVWSPTRDELLTGNTIRRPDGSVVATMTAACCFEWSSTGDVLLGTTGLVDGAIGPATSTVVYSRDGTLLLSRASPNGFLSKDGSRLFYDQPTGVYFSSRIDGTDVRREPEFDGFVNFYQSNAWSPDGQTLAATLQNEIQDHRIVTISLDGSTRVLVDGVDALTPAWSPDGSMLSYYDQSTDRSGWRVVGRDGSQPTSLTPAIWGAPSWRLAQTSGGMPVDTLAFIAGGSLVGTTFDGSPRAAPLRVLLAGNPRLEASAHEGTILIDDKGPNQTILDIQPGQSFEATLHNETDKEWTIFLPTGEKRVGCPSDWDGVSITQSSTAIVCSIGPRATLTVTMTNWEALGTTQAAVYWPSAVGADRSVIGPYFDLLLELQAP